MARVTHVKKARKAYRAHGIKKGESYYWWKFRYGGKHYSKTPPRRSQLTQSSYLSTLYDIEDGVGAIALPDKITKKNVAEHAEAMKAEAEDFASQLRDLGSECESNRSNMPDSLQDSESGQLLEERQQECETAADELEAIDFDDFDADGEEAPEDWLSGKLDEIQAVSIGGG